MKMNKNGIIQSKMLTHLLDGKKYVSYSCFDFGSGNALKI